jgi:hypothetical protein
MIYAWALESPSRSLKEVTTIDTKTATGTSSDMLPVTTSHDKRSLPNKRWRYSNYVLFSSTVTKLNALPQVKASKTRKFAAVKRLLHPSDDRL